VQAGARIVAELLSNGTGPVLLTRASEPQRAACIAVDPRVVELGGCLLWREPAERLAAQVAVVTAGTSDLPVADEVVITLRAAGIDAQVIADVGVAGLHRLLARLDDIVAADAVVVVAGMEGALPSVVAGLTSRPVVAVPTSVGYGASFEGLSALLTMLSSCAPGISVVNIDNGFGAGTAAARIVHGAQR